MWVDCVEFRSVKPYPELVKKVEEDNLLDISLHLLITSSSHEGPLLLNFRTPGDARDPTPFATSQTWWCCSTMARIPLPKGGGASGKGFIMGGVALLAVIAAGVTSMPHMVDIPSYRAELAKKDSPAGAVHNKSADSIGGGSRGSMWKNMDDRTKQ
jgi:hypothetical protein